MLRSSEILAAHTAACSAFQVLALKSIALLLLLTMLLLAKERETEPNGAMQEERTSLCFSA